MQQTFTHIYKNNLWGSDESVSGPGSTIDYTVNLRSHLPELFNRFSINSVFDAPCGDLNWMRHVLADNDLEYVGGDIVLPLIKSHILTFSNSKTKFIHIDLTKQTFPTTDLMICRDCLFHLSFEETKLVLRNFIDSSSKFLLTTTHKNPGRFQNHDISTGGVRLIDLFSVPYHFPREILFRIEDWKPPYQEREMCLWDRDQIIRALSDFSAATQQQGKRATASGTDLGASAADDPPGVAGLQNLARSLNLEGRSTDALVLLEHLARLQPGNVETLTLLTRTLGAAGQTLEAIKRLCALKAVTSDTEFLLEEIRAQMPAAIERFNAHLATGEVVQAENYAAALVALIPRNAALLDAALSCNRALGRKQGCVKYATAIVNVDPAHAGARAVLADAALADAANSATNARSEIAERFAQALTSQPDIHPLVRLRDIHDVASLILCQTLTDQGVSQIDMLLKAARNLVVEVPDESEWAGWVKHYRLAMEALDPSFALEPTPESSREAPISFASSDGNPLNWSGAQAAAKRQGAQAIFFAAADPTYIDLYARWYIKSILKYVDVPCLILVHVIGGAGQLHDFANSLGITDGRLIFAGDRIVAESITTKCYDTPPKGLISKPVAHFQSVRFLRLGSLLESLKLPIFASDIDLVLQRGVSDLLQRCALADIVFNENGTNFNAGSRLTANLLLVNPTDNAALFLRFLKGFLERALGGSEVTRWIDQFALLLARHHLVRYGTCPRVEYFDTNTDINNVMYKSYQEHPFRFLSLYHGFDTSSLESNLAACGEEPRQMTGAPAPSVPPYERGASRARPPRQNSAAI